MTDTEHVRKAAAKLKEAMDMLARGPLDFYLLELVAAHDLLMSRFAPFQVGDRVQLVKAPNFDKAPGWKHSAHFLVPGSVGTVVDGSCGSRGFQFSVIFDGESWIDTVGYRRPKGSVVPAEEDQKHRYCFDESMLTKAAP